MTVVKGYFPGDTNAESMPPKISKEVKALLIQGISLNTTANLMSTSSANGEQDLDDSQARLTTPLDFKVLGNKTEGAILMLAHKMGGNYEQVMDLEAHFYGKACC